MAFQQFRTFFIGMLGGIFAFILLHIEAAMKNASYGAVHTYNNGGKRSAMFGTQNEGQGGLFIFDENEKIRAQMGSYGRGGEKGQSLFGLHDRSEKLRLLNRLHGAKDAPVIVMKDSQGHDQIVFGLDAQTEKPFFFYKTSSGKTENLLK